MAGTAADRNMEHDRVRRIEKTTQKGAMEPKRHRGPAYGGGKGGNPVAAKGRVVTRTTR